MALAGIRQIGFQQAITRSSPFYGGTPEGRQMQQITAIQLSSPIPEPALWHCLTNKAPGLSTSQRTFIMSSDSSRLRSLCPVGSPIPEFHLRFKPFSFQQSKISSTYSLPPCSPLSFSRSHKSSVIEGLASAEAHSATPSLYYML